ncbi:hypothetical protein HDU90_008603 [Geranomyces variabilis]|nr:hypothetical protein HDU90_008603 [Geranomyces variabilis]
MPVTTIQWEDLTNFEDISTGSFGIVRKADYLGTDVAVKQFLDISDQPGFDVQKYISRETEILANVHHPNVLQYMGLAVHETKVYLVTELIGGGHLGAWIEAATAAAAGKENIGWRMRVSFATDIARALVYLHTHNIIHRDLKSENLLLTERPPRVPRSAPGYLFVELMDTWVSIERLRQKEVKAVRHNHLRVPPISAPEIILGMDFDHRVDIFSYGVILCEIITMSTSAHQTFARETPYFGIDPASIHPIGDTPCPPDLLAIAVGCTDADAAKRPLLKDVLIRLRKLEAELTKDAAGPLPHLGVLGSGDSLSPDARSPSMGSLGGAGGGGGEGGSESGSSRRSERPPDSSSPSHGSTGGTLPRGDSSPSVRRIGHTVPHRFSLIARPTMAKCDVCHKRMGLSKKHLQCDDCENVYHKRCGPLAPPACGLSSELRTSLEVLEPRKQTGLHQ